MWSQDEKLSELLIPLPFPDFSVDMATWLPLATNTQDYGPVLSATKSPRGSQQTLFL